MDGRTHDPAVVLADADLLIAATAIAHGRRLVTADQGLAAALARMGLGEHVERVGQD